MISAVSEFKQDSVDLDEQVPNAKEALLKGNHSKQHLYNAVDRRSSNRAPNSGAKSQPRVDIGIPQLPRKQIYQITSEFPVQEPYSSTSDWQRILHKYS